MKSNPSPSAPLNLCPPTGVTGTVLPASPEGVACVPALIKGEHYDVSSLSFVGWTDGDGTGHEGYNVADYFRGGIYLGPDDHGIEPIANLPSPAEPVKVPASPVKDTLEDLTEDEIALAHAQSWPKDGLSDYGAHLDAPASPADSVGGPADPDDMNERRSEWAENAIREFMGESRADRGDALSDLLSDFGHWADRNDTSLEAEIQRAAMHYNDETDGEGTQFSFLDASHAAKDAKIKALESALKAFTGHQIFCSEGDDTAPKYRCRCHACTSVRSAERALALPCA